MESDPNKKQINYFFKKGKTKTVYLQWANFKGVVLGKPEGIMQ